MTFTYQLTPAEKSESKEVVRHLEALKTRELANSATGKYVTRIRLTSDNAGLLAPGFMLKTERVLEIEELENGMTEVRHWQSFAGLGANLVKRKWERVLQEKFLDMASELKKRSLVLEKRARKAGEQGAAVNGVVGKEVGGEEERESEEIDKEGGVAEVNGHPAKEEGNVAAAGAGVMA